MSVTIDGEIQRDKFGHGTIRVDGEKKYGQIWPIKMFMNNIMKIENRPETQEDWKSVVWFYGGPKPSKIALVEIKLTDDKSMMTIYWTLK